MSATVLITFGAVLGLASALQLLVIAVIEIVIASLNLWLVTSVFQAADIGGSIAIHTFGAYFGLAASWALRYKKTEDSGNVPAVNLNEPSYTSDVTAMIGSIFLWIYWPSFNSGLTQTPAEYDMATINTYLSLAAATVTTFFVSAAVNHGKLDMVHIQNSTLAGGVAVGSVCNMHINPGGAVLIGVAAGLLSVMGYKYLTPKLEKCGVPDTCGVNNLHGMPGLLSGVLTILLAALATKDAYGGELSSIFNAMTEDDTGRAASSQALYQLAALGSTMGLAVVGGGVSGLIARTSMFEPLKQNEKYDDELNWELP